jgi:hypothetical protein
VTPTNPSVAHGLEYQFTATGNYTDKSTQDITTVVTWRSSNLLMVAISNAPGSQGEGVAWPTYVGSVTITAVFGSVGGGTILTITD